MSTPSDNAEHGKTHQDLLQTYREVHTEDEMEYDMKGMTGLGPLDDKPTEANLEDFESEIMDLYWSVVDSGVDESLARKWINDLKLNLNKLLRTNQSPDLQDLGSKF